MASVLPISFLLISFLHVILVFHLDVILHAILLLIRDTCLLDLLFIIIAGNVLLGVLLAVIDLLLHLVVIHVHLRATIFLALSPFVTAVDIGGAVLPVSLGGVLVKVGVLSSVSPTLPSEARSSADLLPMALGFEDPLVFDICTLGAALARRSGWVGGCVVALAAMRR